MPSDKEIEEAIGFADFNQYNKYIKDLRDSYLSMKAERDKLKAIVEADTRALDAADSLMNESTGVYGLHLNGDLAPWNDLRTGGFMEEWLLDFDNAIAMREKEE